MSTPLGSSQWMYKTGEEPIAQSLKFNDDESQYLSWTPASAGNRKTWTWSGWVKRGNLGADNYLLSVPDSTGHASFRFNSSTDTLEWSAFTAGYGVATTSATFRDVSAWYHIVLSYDTTNATSTDRIKIYVNGTLQSTSSYTAPTLNIDTPVSNTVTQYIGKQSNSTQYFDGYLADVYFIDGTALDPTSFGETVDGYWKPKEATGLTYGTNGFHLTFQDDIVSEGFNTVTYRGTGATQSVSGLGFEPDFVWIKRRDGVVSHALFDTVRGATKQLSSDTTSAEGTYANSLKSFDNNGFTIGTDAIVNNSGSTYVAWAWDAGTGSAASNTDGSITSTVKANTDYGFSIFGFTGTGATASVGHGLSSAPELIMFKNRSAVSNWNMLTTAIDGSVDYGFLDLTNSFADAGETITSSVVNIFGNFASGNDYIAYAFHSVSGYSSIGSYSGTGATGNAVTGLGFEPAFLMVKRTDSTGWWTIFDNTRNPVNPRNRNLFPNATNAEVQYTSPDPVVDFDSDGFTLQTTDGGSNASGGSYIYYAVADTREYAFWKDVSGNGNHWTPNNLDYRDSLPDTPTNNFATWNYNSSTNLSYAVTQDGNLKANMGTGTGTGFTGTFSCKGGKWYWEVRATNVGNALCLGITTGSGTTSDMNSKGIFYDIYGQKRVFGTTTAGAGATWAAGDIIGMAVDADSAGTISFYKNNVLQFTVTESSILTEDFLPWVYNNSSSAGSLSWVNFGQDSTFAGAKAMGSYTDDNGIGNFQYAPPTGFLALCTSNLPTPTIVDGSQHFNTVLYTGNGSTQSITGVNFQPDWLWLKNRTTANSNALVDSVRGSGTNGFYNLSSNTTNAEIDTTNVTSLDSDGFTLGSNAGTNGSGNALVSWNWKAGGTAVSNTSGSITSQVSANADMGFSVVSYTGTGSAATVGHSLGVAPSMVIVKNRSAADGWLVWHEGLSSGTSYLLLHSTNAQASNSAYFNGSPTSSVFNIGTSTNTNGSGNDLIAYCFANSDIIKVGSYTGNGSSDGPFVYTGFRPAWVMVKQSSAAGNSWEIRDSLREPYNDSERNILRADTSDAEATGAYPMDFLSNGFKPRYGGSSMNGSGSVYIFIAIASTPFKFSPAR